MKCDSIFEDIFEEFYRLSYSLCPTKKSYLKFNDYLVTDYIILRVNTSGYNILYLYTGSSVFIPWKLIDVFTSLDIHSGDKLINSYINCKETIENESLIRFGYLMINLVHYLNGRCSIIDGDKLLETLGEISVIGTKKFRDWYFLKYGEELSPIIYNSLDERIEI